MLYFSKIMNYPELYQISFPYCFLLFAVLNNTCKIGSHHQRMFLSYAGNILGVYLKQIRNDPYLFENIVFEVFACPKKPHKIEF